MQKCIPNFRNTYSEPIPAGFSEYEYVTEDDGNYRSSFVVRLEDTPEHRRFADWYRFRYWIDEKKGEIVFRVTPSTRSGSGAP